MTFNRTPSSAGSSCGDSPSPAGWGIAASLDHPGVIAVEDEKKLQTWERLRKESEMPDFDAYDVPVEARRSFAWAMFRYIENSVDLLWQDEDDGWNTFAPENLS